MRAEELVLRRCLADRDGDDAGGAGAFHAGKVAPQSAEFLFFGIKLFCRCHGGFAIGCQGPSLQG